MGTTQTSINRRMVTLGFIHEMEGPHSNPVHTWMILTDITLNKGHQAQKSFFIHCIISFVSVSNIYNSVIYLYNL
jgi:hypothetical protein